MSNLSETRVGVAIECAVCGYDKKPIGRSAPMGLRYCDDDCPGYRQEPRPGSLWPRESEAQFGYPVGRDGTGLHAARAPGVTRRRGRRDTMTPNEHRLRQHGYRIGVAVGFALGAAFGATLTLLIVWGPR